MKECSKRWLRIHSISAYGHSIILSKTSLRQIFYSKLELLAINALYRINKRSANALSLYSIVLLPQKIVKLYFIALLRYRQLASSKRKNNKLKRLQLLSE